MATAKPTTPTPVPAPKSSLPASQMQGKPQALVYTDYASI